MKEFKIKHGYFNRLTCSFALFACFKRVRPVAAVIQPQPRRLDGHVIKSKTGTPRGQLEAAGLKYVHAGSCNRLVYVLVGDIGAATHEVLESCWVACFCHIL